jgi:uncharacterized protein with HEPN domain
MNNHEPTNFLKDILDSIERIENYVLDLDYEDFSNDQKTVDAVIRNLEVIGEATKNISEEFRNKHPNLPWREMAGMRDKLIHGYFDVMYSIIWETVKNDLPLIKSKIIEILGEE